LTARPQSVYSSPLSRFDIVVWAPLPHWWGKSDWPETPSTADEMIVVTKGFCGYRESFGIKLFR